MSDATPSSNSSPAPSTAPVSKGEPEWWRRTFSSMTGMGLSEEEKRRRKADRDCQKCEQNVAFLKRYSPIVTFMLDNIREAGGNMDDPSTIQCLPCDDMQAGGFSPRYGVLLCQNHLRDRGHTEDTLAHELVHAYDHLRFEVDWMNLRHHACTEIRASSLSGECRWTREAFTRGVWDFTKQHQACVRRRATLSVARHPKCQSDEHAAKVVNEVFDSCFSDTRPFNEIYR